MGSISLQDAALAVGEAVGREIMDFSVGLVGLVQKGSQDEAGDLAGSGTLADMNGTCGVLTAWHVLRHLADKTVGLVLASRFQPRLHRFTLEPKDTHTLRIGSPN